MEGVVTQYDEEFNGVIVNEKAVKISIPGTLIGEKIRYHIEHKSPHQAKAWGRCDALLEASPERIKPPCSISWPVCGACAGCPIMHMSAKTQNAIKKNLVLDELHRAGITYIRDLAYHPSKETLHYRNRTDLVAAERRGKLVLGAYMTRSHEIVPTSLCSILRPPLNQVLTHVTETANCLGIQAYKPVCQYSGALRFVSMFANEHQEVLIDLICTSASGQMPTWLPRFAEGLMEFSPVRGVSFSINDSPNNAIRVAPSTVLAGVDRIPEKHGLMTSLFSASGFTQLNTQMAAKIYASARDWLVSSPHILWDLYCGAGAFGRTLQPVKSLYGAEFSPSAIQAAKKVSQNDAFETHFEVLDLEKQWPDWPLPDVVLVDPPRKGLSRLVLEKLAQIRIPTVIYMSCNPETFAKNVASLSSTYVLERVEAFDMMPQTRHLEVLGLLRRK